ncbi:MAG: GntR family transcriptional regulator [Gammaproteobacteria bacterium]|nr:GntR family transcriptional regulator [Gammaproteobacteria bacterium]
MDFEKKKAIYLQIADYVCEQILLQNWLEGKKIPSVRELAVDIQVNPNTVMRAYAYLEEKNIIETQRGIGYFVANLALKHAVNIVKHEFIFQDLPQMFKSMKLLGIEIDQIVEHYEMRKK